MNIFLDTNVFADAFLNRDDGSAKRALKFLEEQNIELFLNDISFNIIKGEKIGFVGTTGSGKTTTVSLLSRLYEFQSGEILLNSLVGGKYNSSLHYKKQDVSNRYYKCLFERSGFHLNKVYGKIVNEKKSSGALLLSNRSTKTCY